MFRSIRRALPALALSLTAAPAALAGNSDTVLSSASALTEFLQAIADLFAGPLGTAIGIIAFAAVGVYIMYARQTGQAVGSIAKVFVGLLIIFGGTAMVAQISEGVTGAMF